MVEYIERKAALDIVNGWRDQLIPVHGKNDEYVKCLETVAEHLEELHATDVAPIKRGRWIKCGDNQPISCDDVYCCSNCKENRRFEWQLKPFCEECGAKMEVQDGE